MGSLRTGVPALQRSPGPLHPRPAPPGVCGATRPDAAGVRPPTQQVFSPEAAGSTLAPEDGDENRPRLSGTHRRRRCGEVIAALCACPLRGPLIRALLTAPEVGELSRPGRERGKSPARFLFVLGPSRKEPRCRHPPLVRRGAHSPPAPQPASIPTSWGNRSLAPASQEGWRVDSVGLAVGLHPRSCDRW